MAPAVRNQDRADSLMKEVKERLHDGLAVRAVGALADGRVVHEYLLDNGRGLTLAVLDLGGIVTALRCPDREGRSGTVAVGLADLEDYLGLGRGFGSLIGRYAGRIARASFTLDGQAYALTANEGVHTLHGGLQGLGERFWSVTPVPGTPPGEVAIELALVSPHGDQGFPGTLAVRVRYTLTAANEWRIDYHATSDQLTPFNPTHHVYWNLAGGGSIEGHRLHLPASRFAEVDDELIPQALRPVEGTPLDFRAGRRIADGLRDAHAQIRVARGYDHFFVLDRSPSGLALAARLEDPHSGRVLEIETSEPGVQFYSGNFLDGRLRARSGAALRQGDALCLETQHIGDAPNRPDGPSTLLRPGQVFASSTVHRFSVAG
jgi:aldose 1-epimerase